MSYTRVNSGQHHFDYITPAITYGSSEQQQPQQHDISPESQSLAQAAEDDAANHYSTVGMHETTPSRYWSNPQASVQSPPKHQRDWSGSTAADSTMFNSGENEKLHRKPVNQSSSTSSSSSRKIGVLTKSGTWNLEIVSLIIAFAAIGAILGVLARFDGRALPEWPYYITLNALIALLATVATANMAISLQNGLSQLKWIRFKESRAPLTDMETFDEASRGTWGALKLLFTGRGGWLGSFGATIALVALALGPFAQQIVRYGTRSVTSNDVQSASIGTARNYTVALPGKSSPTGYVPILPLKSAVYNGLFAENGRPNSALPFECSTGNCTWNPFETLGVCHECVDLTPFMTRYCAPDAAQNGCGWQVPQGGLLNTSADVFSMTSLIPSVHGDMPHSTIMRLIFMGTESQNGIAGELKPWARQCSMSACVQNISSTVSNGILEEKLTSSTTNHTVIDMTTQPEGADFGVYITGSDNSTYLLSEIAMLSMRGWFSSVFTNGSAVRTNSTSNLAITDNNVVVNLTVGISSGETFFDTDIVTAFYWNYYEYKGKDGIAMLMSDTSVSMTTAFRSLSGVETVIGNATSMESYVHVRWPFAVLPIVVILSTAVFLLAAIYRTHQSQTKLFKSSALALLFHPLHDDITSQISRSSSLNEKIRQARNLRVQLEDADDGRSMLRG